MFFPIFLLCLFFPFHSLGRIVRLAKPVFNCFQPWWVLALGNGKAIFSSFPQLSVPSHPGIPSRNLTCSFYSTAVLGCWTEWRIPPLSWCSLWQKIYSKSHLFQLLSILSQLFLCICLSQFNSNNFIGTKRWRKLCQSQ